jgi:pyruvate, orthophosphate dikinase
MDNKPQSKALAENLSRTRTDNIILPDDFVWFLGLSENYWGVYQRTREFVEEFHHPYVNYKVVGEGLQKTAISDFWLYSSIEENQRALTFISSLIQSVMEKCSDNKLCDILIHTFSRFTGMMSSDERLFSDVIFHNLNTLSSYLSTNRSYAVLFNGSSIRQGLMPLESSAVFSDAIMGLYKNIAHETYHFWQEQVAAAGKFDTGLWTGSEKSREIFRHVKDELFPELFQKLDQCLTTSALNEQVMFFTDLANYHRRLLDQFTETTERFQFLIFLLHLPVMEHLSEHLLWDLNKILRTIVKQLTPEQTQEFINYVFGIFDEIRDELYHIILDCILTLGKELTEHERNELIPFFEQKVIEFGFAFPGEVKITDQWKLHVNPNHLKNIRVWLEIIETAPLKYRKLLSSLIANLKLGGIFIFDTDLFQRDVTRLLNTDIRDAYKQIKQLCRLFPVYYSDIGAEGELRDVSTAIDNVSYRRDKLIHFVRKQVHIESNNSHIRLLEKVFDFWLTGNIEPLKPHLPDDVIGEIDVDGEWVTPMKKLIVDVAKSIGCHPWQLLTVSSKKLENIFAGIRRHKKVNKERLRYLCRLYELLQAKYSFNSDGLFAGLSTVPTIAEEEITDLKAAVCKKDNLKSLVVIFNIMEKLNAIVLSPTRTEGWEDIYYKRHVAFGIPSMYGKYREPKFEALGFIFKLEFLAGKIMDDIVHSMNLSYFTAKKFDEITELLYLYHRGMQIDGISNQGFMSNLEMLKYSLSSQSFSMAQHINIFQFMGENIKELINKYFFRPYDDVLKIVVAQLYADDSHEEHLLARKSEEFYRNMLASAFLIQSIDNFLQKILFALRNMVENYSDQMRRDILTYNPDMIISPLYAETPHTDNSVFLGSKAFFLKKLYQLGFPVPPGFVLTTEVFRRKDTILHHTKLNSEIDSMIRQHIKSLEKMSGQQMGNPANLLLLSVRSGTAVSMPGAMNSFLNVGMNDAITEGLSKQFNFGWTSWDCYRRFLQSWGMAYDIPRDEFDQIMLDYKQMYGIKQKVQFTPTQMRDIAYSYKEKLIKNQIPVEEEPFAQLKAAILLVFDSWSTSRAKVYRKHLQIADEWGTAVIVQKMVLGNINDTSGTGVFFTRNPYVSDPGLHLYGDYSMVSQGEDVVGGLVHVLPVSESQKTDSTRDLQSLETAFPEICKLMKAIALELTEKHGFGHQEIEFTFETEKPSDFYVLQTRDLDIPKAETTTVFDAPEKDKILLTHGTGIGKGAMNGIVFFDFDDLHSLRKQFPDQHMILVKPDTVPDDIGLIFECDGLVTARGGATSHAAVTAMRLGKICIVNCNELTVIEKEKQFSVNSQIFRSGDKISIDGTLGNIYKGHYKIERMKL